MQIPTIPPSVRTSATGFLGVLCGWIATIPGLPSYVTIPAGMLSVAFLGGGLVLAADHKSVQQIGAGGRCAACGRPASEAAPPGQV
jgi:hypothetical protein